MEGGLQANRLRNFSLVENKFDFSTTFTLVCRGPKMYMSQQRRRSRNIEGSLDFWNKCKRDGAMTATGVTSDAKLENAK